MARKILLADDSVTAQNMGRKILTDAGYDVVTVNNGSAALKRVGEQKPDLIVLDVYMPGYSGLEVCARLKDAPDTSRIPILLTVGKLEPFKPEEASRVRADAFIVKPFEASELLSALTRLEDRMVPQADGARFSTTVSGIERFSAGDPAVRQDPEETGWKNRLRFPSKKKKEEPEPEPEEDFGTTPYRDFKKGKGKAPARGSFAVNSAPAPGQEPGLVPDIPRDITPEELDALSELVAKLDGPIPAAENVAPLGAQIAAVETPTKPDENKQEEIKTAAPVAAEATPPAETSPPVAAETATEPVVVKAEAEAAAVAAREDTAPPVESAAKAPEPVAEAMAPETVPQESEPAPVAVAAAANPPESARNEAKEFTVVASPETAVAAEPPALPEPIAEPVPVAQVEEPKAEAAPQLQAAEESAPVPAAIPAIAEPAPPVPSQEDLAEALRLLTPSQAGQTLAEAGAVLAEELARGSAAETRWVAENVALSPEEASLSLEAEMFKSFATGPSAAVAAGDHAAPTSSPVRHEEEEAAEAAVEAAEAVAVPAAPDDSAPAPTAETEVAEPVAVETRQEYSAAASAEEAAEEAPQEEVAAVTFADAIRSEERAEETSALAESANAEDEAGGADDMAKDAKGKGKWHQIHSTPEPAAKTDAVEAAKQLEETPKAMAAAASAEGASEANAIASIVDSVLADLKPKIVEEIAKKLAKK